MEYQTSLVPLVAHLVAPISPDLTVCRVVECEVVRDNDFILERILGLNRQTLFIIEGCDSRGEGGVEKPSSGCKSAPEEIRQQLCCTLAVRRPDNAPRRHVVALCRPAIVSWTSNAAGSYIGASCSLSSNNDDSKCAELIYTTEQTAAGSVGAT